MSYDEDKRERLMQIKTIKSALDVEEEVLLRELRASCSHDVVLSCKDESSLKPRRVCIFCSTEEESRGWSNMYDVLPDRKGRDVRMVERNEIYRHRSLHKLATTVITTKN